MRRPLLRSRVDEEGMEEKRRGGPSYRPRSPYRGGKYADAPQVPSLQAFETMNGRRGGGDDDDGESGCRYRPERGYRRATCVRAILEARDRLGGLGGGRKTFESQVTRYEVRRQGGPNGWKWREIE